MKKIGAMEGWSNGVMRSFLHRSITPLLLFLCLTFSALAYVPKDPATIDALVAAGWVGLTTQRCIEIGTTVKSCRTNYYDQLYADLQNSPSSNERNFAATLWNGSGSAPTPTPNPGPASGIKGITVKPISNLADPANGQTLVFDSTNNRFNFGSPSAATAGGSSGQLQYNNGGVFAGLTNVKYDSTHSAFTVNGDIPFDLGDTGAVGANGAKLNVFGSAISGDKPSLAIIGDYRSGSSGERYYTRFGPNGSYASNTEMELVASPYPKAFPPDSLTIITDVPTCQVNWTPYNQAAGGIIFRGAGIPTTGDQAPTVFDLTSQGKLTLSNPYDTFNSAQLVIRDTSPSHTGTYPAFGFRVRNDSLTIGHWNAGSEDFATPYAGAIDISPTDVTATGDLTVHNSQYNGSIYFGDKANGSFLRLQGNYALSRGISAGYFTPDSDGAISLGVSGYRWGDGNFSGTVAAGNLRGTVSTGVPGSAGATGTAGTIAMDANYIYVCVATNTWKRAALSTW